MIPLPPTFVADLLDNVQTLFSDFSGLITLIMGVLLAAVVIEMWISSLRK